MRIDAFELPGLTRLVAFGEQPATLVAHVDAAAWTGVAAAVEQDGGRLVTMWGAEDRSGALTVCAAYAVEDGLLWVRLPLGKDSSATGEYPDLSALFPCA